jgi:acetyl esterase/lipase
VVTSGGAAVLRLTLEAGAQAFAGKEANEPTTFVSAKQMHRFYLWTVSGDKTIDDAAAGVPALIKSEFVNLKPTVTKAVTVAGVAGKSLFGEGTEADDGDPGSAEVVLFALNGHVFAACVHGEGDAPALNRNFMMTALGSAREPSSLAAPSAQGKAGANASATTKEARPLQTPMLADNTILHKDVAYGGPDAAMNVLDIYAPAHASKAPVLIFVHGGEWTKGDKQEISCKPKFLNEHGIVMVSVNYRLSPKYKHPAQVDDVAAAIAWVHKHIDKYGGDGGKIVIMGHSAGCHLVTLVALNPEPLAKVKMKPSDLRGVVAWSGGMYDLAQRASGTGMYPPFIRATFGETQEAQRAASPITYAKNAKSGPTFLFASVDDDKSQSSRDASDMMVKAINDAGGNAKSAILVGKSHFTANHELGAPGDKTGQQLLDFIASVIR